MNNSKPFFQLTRCKPCIPVINLGEVRVALREPGKIVVVWCLDDTATNFYYDKDEDWNRDWADLCAALLAYTEPSR